MVCGEMHGVKEAEELLLMNSATYKMLKVALTSDETIVPEQRNAVLAILNDRVPKNAALPLVLTQKAAAERLGVSRFTIRKMTIKGDLHPVRIHESWRYRRAELETIINGSL